MPEKPKRAKGKHPHQSKKSKAIIRSHNTATPSAMADTSVPVAAVSNHRPPEMVALKAKAKTIHHPYIAGELRLISIMAAIILVILIVLSLVLS